ncbi:MAG: NAD-dependent epimerase/dehydratase family protein [Gemmatimonadaceae bacterium]|nr:NAD-dependent epimerase/dehydratase family protein [Gemmatimonadaceae bacterium]
MSALARDTRPLLVTGGAGFIGGAVQNVHWLKERWDRRITMIEADVRDHAMLGYAAREAGAVFHLAAQVAVTTSLDDPLHDFEVNVAATVSLLDAIRRRGEPVPLVFASTNKVYGSLHDVDLEIRGDAYAPSDAHHRLLGVGESRPLDFHTPYGCSKGAADQYVLDFARCYGIPAIVLRKSCVYGRRQMGTEDQGWVAHFAICALEERPITIYGDGRQVRDLLDVADTVEAYVQAWKRHQQVAGRAFNLGGGPENATSLRDVLAHIERLVGRGVRVEHADWRPGDQRWYVTDARRARTELHLPAFTPWRSGVAELVSWLAEQRRIALPSPLRRATPSRVAVV